MVVAVFYFYKNCLETKGHFLSIFLKNKRVNRHRLNLTLMGNQFIVPFFLFLIFFVNICAISSSCKQERMHLFHESWIFFQYLSRSFHGTWNFHYEISLEDFHLKFSRYLKNWKYYCFVHVLNISIYRSYLIVI